jgi:hypothetical protein
MRLAGYKRTKLAPGVTRYERKVGRAGDEGHYDTDLPWVCWWFLSTDRETRFTGRCRVLMECAVCGERRRFRFPIPRFGPIPDRGEHPVRTRFKLAHLHRDKPNPMAWARPLLNPAAHRKGIDLDLLAMRLEADLRARADQEED